MSALLLTDAEITDTAHVTRLSRESTRSYVLQVNGDPRPCGESTVMPHRIGDDPYQVWRMTGSTVHAVTFFASSATEVTSPSDAHEFLGQVAAAAKRCKYSYSEAAIDGNETVRLGWNESGYYRDLVVIRDGNMIFQVAASQDGSQHAHYVDLLARRLIAKWNAYKLTSSARPSSSETSPPTSSPATPQRSPSSDPQPTGTPPQPPGCVPPICANAPLDIFRP